MSTRLSDEEATALLGRLKEHFGEPVLPASRYCNALRVWSRRMLETRGYNSQEGRAITEVELLIRKSDLLARLIYDGEELRTRECPVHKGVWCGIAPCPHGCGSTGWIPNDWPDAAPRCTRHPDQPAVSRTISVHATTEDCWDCYRERWETFHPTTPEVLP